MAKPILIVDRRGFSWRRLRELRQAQLEAWKAGDGPGAA